MKTYLSLSFLLCAFWSQAQVIPVGFLKTKVGAILDATYSATNITGTSAVSGGNIISDEGSTITSRGLVWGTTSGSSTYSLIIGAGTGSFTGTLTGLTGGTKYYVRAFAINSGGISYGQEINFTSSPVVISPYTGKTWMDRNLGATQVATSSTDAASFGDLYQWGRANDGGALRTAPNVTLQLTNISIRSTNYIRTRLGLHNLIGIRKQAPPGMYNLGTLQTVGQIILVQMALGFHPRQNGQLS